MQEPHGPREPGRAVVTDPSASAYRSALELAGLLRGLGDVRGAEEAARAAREALDAAAARRAREARRSAEARPSS